MKINLYILVQDNSFTVSYSIQENKEMNMKVSETNMHSFPKEIKSSLELLLKKYLWLVVGDLEKNTYEDSFVKFVLEQIK